ncbi:MAG: hypothetical protein OJF55_002482 [Rhodanobacteraceae bacterium]|nr:MAG: hypothetical protein OJF55_002482 [Rhodanobacteraceae bacterium]
MLSGLLLPTLAAAQINSLPSAPHLLVKGHAEARVVPDRFTIHLNVDVTDMSPDVARRKVEMHMQQLFSALDANGAIKDQTHASSLSIQPRTEYEDNKSVFKGTNVSRSIDATFGSLEKLRAFIAAVPADKEVQIGGIQTARSDIDAISSRLRAAAIENSKAAAKRIAADYGMKIVGVYAVSEVAPDFAYGIQAGSWGGPQTLQSVVVTASGPPPGAPPPPPGVAMRVGTMSVQQDIYAVYLTAEK